MYGMMPCGWNPATCHSTRTQHTDTAQRHSTRTQYTDTAHRHSTRTQHTDTAHRHSTPSHRRRTSSQHTWCEHTVAVSQHTVLSPGDPSQHMVTAHIGATHRPAVLPAHRFRYGRAVVPDHRKFQKPFWYTGGYKGEDGRRNRFSTACMHRFWYGLPRGNWWLRVASRSWRCAKGR